MLIRTWDRGSEAEWREFLADRDFGILAANGPAGSGPVLVPVHFLLDADAGEILLHLAAPNPLWAAVREDPAVTLAVTDDYAFAPGAWRGEDGAYSTPTSYYASVHFSCTAEPIEDAAGKAAVLNRQLARFEPDHPGVVPGVAPFGPQLSGLQGLRLTIRQVRAKFKYDDKKPVEQQAALADRLAERGSGLDAAVRAQLLRRNALRCPVDHAGNGDRAGDADPAGNADQNRDMSHHQPA